MNISRHKVFISYYHFDDQKYKNYLCDMKYFNSGKMQYESIFEDYSVRDGDIDDTYMTDEQIRCKIRDEYIKNATVLILLVGLNTKNRKHVDWEIHAAMYNSEFNPQMGILVINLPSISQGVRVSDESEKNIVSPYNSNWKKVNDRSEFEKIYPYMPSRIIDNFVSDVPISVVDWNTIYANKEGLMKLIDNAFNRKDSIKYNHSAPLRRKNS